jgi:small conductance mechanosensitive channel
VSFGVSYDADIDHTVRTLREAVTMTAGILDQPEPVIKLIECADSSLTFMIRVWCLSQDYFNVNWGLIENGKRLLDREGIEIPYPQMDVHMK